MIREVIQERIEELRKDIKNFEWSKFNEKNERTKFKYGIMIAESKAAIRSLNDFLGEFEEVDKIASELDEALKDKNSGIETVMQLFTKLLSKMK